MFESKAFLALVAGFFVGVLSAIVVGFVWSVFLILFLGVLASFIIAGARRAGRILLFALLLGAILIGYVRVSVAVPLAPETPALFADARASLVERMEQVISGAPQAMLAAMTLGDRSGLSDTVKEVFNRTGTRHIVAISGLHMAIVLVIVFKLLIVAGFWRRHAFWLSLVVLAGFVLLVGAPASAIRASIMAAMYLIATQVGRLTQAWRLLVAAALVMVAVQPFVLLSVSFQLSFAAVLGIILFKPWLDTVLQWIPWGGVRDLASVSLAAQLTTWPIVAYTFERVSVVGVIANLVAVPVLPLVMVLGIGFLLVGWMIPFLAKIFLWSAWVILRALLTFLEYLAALPFAAFSVGVFGILTMVVYYALLGGLYWRLVSLGNYDDTL